MNPQTPPPPWPSAPLRDLLDEAARRGSSPLPRSPAEARRRAEQVRRRTRRARAGVVVALVAPTILLVSVVWSGDPGPVAVVNAVPAGTGTVSPSPGQSPSPSPSPAPSPSPSNPRVGGTTGSVPAGTWEGFAFPDLEGEALDVDSTLSSARTLELSLPAGCGEQTPRPSGGTAVEQVLQLRGVVRARGATALPDTWAARQALADLRRAWATCSGSGPGWAVTPLQVAGADEALVVTGGGTGGGLDLHLVVRAGRVLWFGGRRGLATSDTAGRDAEVAVLQGAFGGVAADLRDRWPGRGP